MTCSNCGTENRAGAKFCRVCGTSLALTCPNGHPVESGSRFCDECGAAVAPAAASPPTATAPAQPPPVAERRLVSVLFCDLVGFTTLSEGRDADDVRDLLSRYFDTSRQLISRYGGTVEKFIGDAVMAVWGAPVAQEDDAERAVRAALDLVAAVEALGSEAGVPELRARAGVLTGEAAVTIGAQAEGMVAGDMVNTASRIQTAAQPGTVLVGEATRRATDRAVAYEDAGLHELKGKAEPVRLYRAMRVVGGLGGALKSEGLEAPFVGRDRELRIIKDLFHETGEERRAHLVSVVGIAGIGKSRLSWEFYKYIDGLKDTVRWHRGRCLAYGEGVTYWALAEMVRRRAGIAEAEEPESAQAKLHEAVVQWVPDPEERARIEPRLAHLLGLEERTAPDAEDLFSAWRLFFERIAQQDPVILVFEDMQWADPSLLDFVEYLMNWSRTHPIFVLVLARPELGERRPGWGVGQRGFTTLYLEPLSRGDMEAMLAGLVPGLPEGLRDEILARAEGIPLYAMETVRMLLDRGLLVRDEASYRLTSDVPTLDVPESLQGLIAARLDGLSPQERTLLQDASVLGKTFTPAALAAITGAREADIDPLLASLVRKELVFVQADPRSPERGQYGFLQDLVRKVAFDTLSKRDRVARHLAAGAYLEEERGQDEPEIAEVVASHYLAAYELAPDAADAPDIKSKARDALIRAADRSRSLAAAPEALRYYEQAIGLTDDPLLEAELHERAGAMAWAAGSVDAVRPHYARAIQLYQEHGDARAAARTVAKTADIAFQDGRMEEALARMEEALAVLSSDRADDPTVAELMGQTGRLLYFMGRPDEAVPRLEKALELAEKLMLPEVFAQVLQTKAIVLSARGRVQEAELLLRHALEVALGNDLRFVALRAYNNLASTLEGSDRFDEAMELISKGREMALAFGDRTWELKFRTAIVPSMFTVGRWDEAVSVGQELLEDETVRTSQALSVELASLALISVNRGDIDAARRTIDALRHEQTEEVQVKATWALGRAQMLLLVEGGTTEALEAAEEGWQAASPLGLQYGISKAALFTLGEVAAAARRYDRLNDLVTMLAGLGPGEMSPSLRGHEAKWRAALAAVRGEGDPDALWRRAEQEFRDASFPLWLGTALVEHAEWLVSQGRVDDAAPLLSEARDVFGTLKARPWLERVEQLLQLQHRPAAAPA